MKTPLYTQTEAVNTDGLVGRNGSSGLQFFVAEGSTREGPIIRIKGQDERGKPFESTFHLKQVDTSNANFPEIMALVSYREFFGNVPF